MKVKKVKFDEQVIKIIACSGSKGEKGTGISSVEKTSTSGLVDTYTITYDDATTSTFQVTNGSKGDRGEQGETGQDGIDGRGIESIDKTSTSGLVDTYTISYTDETTDTFEVTNGKDGDVTEEHLQEELDETTKMIFNIFPSVEDTGTEITLDETAEVKFKKIDLKGNTSQYTTTGKNLLGLLDGTNTSGGLNVTRSNNKITFSGTASSTYPNTGNVPYILAQGTYTISSTNNSYDFYLWFRNSSNETIYTANLSKGTKTISITTNDVSSIVIGVEHLTTGTQYNIETSIQIEQGSTATPYEPYTGGVASPNPSYPQDVNVVTGDNTIDICGKNLFNKNTITTGAYLKEDGTLLASSTDYITSDFIPIQPNTTYYKTQTLSPRTKFYDANKQVLNNTTYQDVSIGGNAGSFTTPNNAYYFRFTGNVNTSTGININNVMVHKGSTATTYEPYQQSQSYSINLGSLELCKLGDYQDYIYKENKKWYKYGAIGKVVLDGSNDEIWSRSGATTETSFVGALSLQITGLITKFNTGDYWFCDKFTYGSLGVDYRFRLYNGDASAGYTFLGLTIPTSLASDINTFRIWLGNNNVTLYYVLNTPTTTEITDTTLISQLEALRNAESYEGQTNISQVNDDLPFIISASALYDLNNLVTRVAILETE